jgi:hypothetical protein
MWPDLIHQMPHVVTQHAAVHSRGIYDTLRHLHVTKYESDSGRIPPWLHPFQSIDHFSVGVGPFDEQLLTAIANFIFFFHHNGRIRKVMIIKLTHCASRNVTSEHQKRSHNMRGDGPVLDCPFAEVGDIAGIESMPVRESPCQSVIGVDIDIFLFCLGLERHF